jgi:hypothetical protein
VRHWATGTAAPCVSIFKPVTVDQPIDVGSPTDRFDDASVWWRGELVHRRVIGNPAAFLPRLAIERLPVEYAWFDEPPESKDAFLQAAQMTDRWIESAELAATVDQRPWFVRRYWEKRNQRAGFPRRRSRSQTPRAASPTA